MARCLLALLLARFLVAADTKSVAEAAFDELVRRDFAALAGRSAPGMELRPETLTALRPALDHLGALRFGRPLPQVASAAGIDTFTFPAEFENGKVDVVISLNSDAQVVDLRLLSLSLVRRQDGEGRRVLAGLLSSAGSEVVAEAAFDEFIRRDVTALHQRFSPGMKLRAEAVAAPGEALQALGTLLSLHPAPQVASIPGADMFTFPAEFENGKANVVILVDSLGRVADLRLAPLALIPRGGN